MKVEEYEYSSSDDEAPEAVSLAQSRTETLGRIKEQAKARQAAKERRKTVDTNRKAQIEVQKAKVQAALEQLQSGKESVQKAEASTPTNLKAVESKLIKFEYESEEEADELLPQG
jgi:hydroxylamine reductase (hybrid-cluster protein)